MLVDSGPVVPDGWTMVEEAAQSNEEVSGTTLDSILATFLLIINSKIFQVLCGIISIITICLALYKFFKILNSKFDFCACHVSIDTVGGRVQGLLVLCTDFAIVQLRKLAAAISPRPQTNPDENVQNV